MVLASKKERSIYLAPVSIDTTSLLAPKKAAFLRDGKRLLVLEESDLEAKAMDARGKRTREGCVNRPRKN